MLWRTVGPCTPLLSCCASGTRVEKSGRGRALCPVQYTPLQCQALSYQRPRSGQRGLARSTSRLWPPSIRSTVRLAPLLVRLKYYNNSKALACHTVSTARSQLAILMASATVDESVLLISLLGLLVVALARSKRRAAGPSTRAKLASVASAQGHLPLHDGCMAPAVHEETFLVQFAPLFM